MTEMIDKKIKSEEVQKELTNRIAEISALSSGDIKKYEFLTNKDMLPSSIEMIIQDKKFHYSPLGKKIDTQTKTIEEVGKKQVKALEMSLDPFLKELLCHTYYL